MKTQFDGERINITIKEYTPKATKTGGKFIQVKDENDNTYSFFDKVGIWENDKMVGEKESAAYRDWMKLGADPIGKTIEIGYKEKEGEYMGKKTISRRILFLKEVHSDGNYEMNANGTYAPGQDVKVEIPF